MIFKKPAATKMSFQKMYHCRTAMDISVIKLGAVTTIHEELFSRMIDSIQYYMSDPFAI